MYSYLQQSNSLIDPVSPTITNPLVVIHNGYINQTIELKRIEVLKPVNKSYPMKQELHNNILVEFFLQQCISKL